MKAFDPVQETCADSAGPAYKKRYYCGCRRTPMPADGVMNFLAEHFSFLGIDFQYWMPITVGAVALYVLYLWKTDRFR